MKRTGSPDLHPLDLKSKTRIQQRRQTEELLSSGTLVLPSRPTNTHILAAPSHLLVNSRSGRATLIRAQIRFEARSVKMFNTGHRSGGDIPVGQPDGLSIPDRVKFDRSRGIHSTKYVFPPAFHPGTGRTALLNKSLLPLYGDIGGLLNALDHEEEYIRTSDSCEWVKDKLRVGVRDLKDDISDASDFASSLIGEIIAIGGNYHIPEDLQGTIRRPHRLNRCLEQIANTYLPELYTVPYVLPSEKCKLSTPAIISELSWQTMSLGKCNSALSDLYSQLGFHINRIEYLELLSRQSRLGSGRNVLQVHAKQTFVLFEKAIFVISSKISTDRDGIFMMPEELREKVLAFLISKKRDPTEDVSILYDRFSRDFEGGYPVVDVTVAHLCNFRTLMGNTGRSLIDAAGGILPLAQSSPADIAANQALRTHIVFKFLTTDEQRAEMSQKLAKVCLNALHVDISRALTTVRTTYYGECLFVQVQALTRRIVGNPRLFRA